MPTLALCMIVKNEEEMLAGCLESVKGIVDEMIVVDTGSTDNTKQIALDAGAKVFDFEWINDFAAARNYAKSKTDCDFILSLDADERFYQPDKDLLHEALHDFPWFVGYLQLTNSLSVKATVEDVLFGEMASGYGIFVPRLLKNVPGNDWIGRVHEIPEKHVNAKYFKANIVHLGGDQEFRDLHQKGRRNLELLEQIMLEEPNQQPMFYTYLAGEREAVGDSEGFFEALEMGWKATLDFLKTKPEGVYANTGIAALYPAVLFSKNRFVEGFNAFGVLLENLTEFSTNPCNTLYQLLQTSLQLTLPLKQKDDFYEAILAGSNLLLTFADDVFPEPTIEGATDYKALLMKALALFKLQRFEEAQTTIDQARKYSTGALDVELMQIEMWLEQGNIEECLTSFLNLLEKNLTNNPDVWILGAVILIGLGQNEDAQSYIQQVINMPTRKYVSRHRISLLKGLFTRQCLFEGNPISGVGAYGVLGAILSRTPVESVHTVPSTLIEEVVVRYIQLDKVELLLRFFDKRAEHILPGVGQLVRNKLTSLGLELVDDGSQPPIVLVGTNLSEILGAFKDTEDMTVLKFTESEEVEILQEIEKYQTQSMEDLLMGAMSFLADEEDESPLETLFHNKCLSVTNTPVLVWDSKWPVDILENILPSKQVVLYLGNLDHIEQEQDLQAWNRRHVELLNAMDGQLFFRNVLQIVEAPQTALDEMFSHLGLVTPSNAAENLSIDLSDIKDWGNIFTEDVAQSILKQWQFID